MHQDFPDWYRNAGLTPPEGLLQKRWDSVDALSRTEDRAILLSLLQLYLLPRAGDEACHPSIRDEFRKTDDTFPGRGNVQELRVLSGATLRWMMEEDAPCADTAALGILAGMFPSRSEQLSHRAHVEAAERYGITSALRQRERRDLPQSLQEIWPTKDKLDPLLAAVAGAASPAAVGEPLRNLLEGTLKPVATALRKAEEWMKTLNATVRAKEEEIDFLWWLTSSHSKSQDVRFRELGIAQASLVLPLEIADLTRLLPGPASAVPVLLQALLTSGAESTTRTITLADAVNATKRDWREKNVTLPADVGGLCPIHLAVRKSLDTDGSDEWLPVYRKACDVPGEVQVQVGAMATQFYREALFLRAVKVLDG